MKKKITFTIITPVLNSDRFIKKTLLSIKRQSFQNFEHIIIDGAIDTPWINEKFPDFAKEKKRIDGLMNPDDIAKNYLWIHKQEKNSWTHELDLRPWNEKW